MTGLLLYGVISWAGTASTAVFFPEEFTLGNGMKVVVVHNPRAPVVAHMVWYKVGSADEPRGNSGVAHLLEHLMFKETKTVAAGEFSRLVARHGGRDNAFTSWDYTGYFQMVPVDRLEMVMRLEADRMVNLRLEELAIVTERNVVLEERRQRVENNPAAQLNEQTRGTLFLHHPYGTPIIGWAHEIRGLDLADARAFYDQWYAPNNAILVVSGSITAEGLKPLAEKYYGSVPARPVPERTRTEEPSLSTARRVVLEHSLVRQAQLNLLYKAPSYREGLSDMAEPLEILAEVLGSGSVGKLYQRLVVRRPLATSVDVSYSANAYDLSVFGFHVVPAADVSVESLEAAIRIEIDDVVHHGVTAAEVADAKQRLLARVDYARDSVMGPAYALGSALAIGLSIQHVEQWPERIAAVTVEAVNTAARAVLADPDHVTSILAASRLTEGAR